MFLLQGLLFAASVGGSGGVDTSSALEPVGENQTQPPPAEPGNPYPERLNLKVGSGRGYKWINARGYVHAPLSSVWRAMQEPEVVVDRRKVASWTVQKGVLPAAQASFRINNTVHDLIKVEFEVTWQAGVTGGTPEAPETVVAVYRKTGGTHVIKLMAGSIVARRVSDTVTEIELIEHLDAMMRAGESAASYNRDLFESIAAHARGEGIPRY